jgi:hypothetical protein
LSDPLDGASLGLLLYPLHGLSERMGLVVITALFEKGSKATENKAFFLDSIMNESMSPTDLSHVLYGLQKQDGKHNYVAQLHRLVEAQMANILTICVDSNPSPEYDIHKLQILRLNLKIFLSYSVNLDKTLKTKLASHYDTLDFIIENNEKIISRTEKSKPLLFRSQLEQKVCKVLMSALRKLEVEGKSVPKVAFNETLHAFEADIVIRFPKANDTASDSSYVVLNVEVDGPRHRHRNVRMFTDRRDHILTSEHDVVVARLSESLLSDLDETNILKRIASTLELAATRADSGFQTTSSTKDAISKRRDHISSVYGVLLEWAKE